MASQVDVSFRLPRRPWSVPRARAALHAVLGDWGAGDDLLHTAELVLSELVTNALRVRVPADRQVGIRIAHSSAAGLLRLEVSDAGSGWPERTYPATEDEHGRGLQVVDTLSHRWGVSPRPGGIGKTVWSELKAPALTPAPHTRQLAAIAIRAGHQIRAWGTWQTILSVATLRHTTGTLTVTLTLADGPPLRLPAAEPVAVRGLP
ncbi:ATP-binding protein [Streptomyces sp. H27-H1]|uniref:ATP-binding protein n=1 Tax=Streptomyces sp. H27-H1 TaxID=2996461 RepID=UPI002271519A|nr:ATP-binding protein [Streptomyces sp. H27-H1]MCY0927570.1 ATP-binding protein [Streptomyces sp. H27-H1]